MIYFCEIVIYDLLWLWYSEVLRNLLCSSNCLAVFRLTDPWPWRKKEFRLATVRCPASPRETSVWGTASTSCPNACRTSRLPSAVHQALPATWPTWVTYRRSPTPDTCCPLPRPFTLPSVTPTTPIARLSGLNLTEATPGPELLCLWDPMRRH